MKRQTARSGTRRKPFAHGVRWKNGAWRYRVPRWVDDATVCRVFGCKREVTLGKTDREAMAEWVRLQSRLGTTHGDTLGDWMDRFLIESLPTKKPATQRQYRAGVARLRPIFGHLQPTEFRTAYAFKYLDRNKDRYRAATHDIETLGAVFTFTIKKGGMDSKDHPLRGMKIKEGLVPRARYVTDDELRKALELASPFLNAYIRLKVSLGLRKADMLRIRLEDATAEGIRAVHSKTGQGTLYAWNDERRAAWDACLKVRPKHFPRLLFLTRDGKSYLSEDGTTSGFDSQWQRFMAKVVKAGVERFTEHDLRAKVATDSPDLETARKRLGHKSAATTRGVYDRKDERAE